MQIDFVRESQYNSLAGLLYELHRYYNEGSTVTRENTLDHLTNNLLAANSGIQLVVACDADNRVLGFAAVSLVYSLVEPEESKNRQCALKELYVRTANRNQGIGEALMSWIAQFALANKCCRIDWPVKESNAKGIAFYERLGAERVADRLSYRLSKKQMQKLTAFDQNA
ncbi:GNAT family N-acetyltransferase [Pelagicoccus mobilis]|uniref:GNAT family N-acetyltransferase n=1 Tax=Pelagicoccus mobilis TaxID=415221 RepID=A0A934RVT8_9BACT|nr:GNAT family N-acetyltransferase [Pelagicoccus mobilis]MBK1877303.1 GNAT family N-acetyltransferase [Pelagicoccus mobilis]